MNNIKIFSGSRYPALARRVCRRSRIELNPSMVHPYNSTGCFEYQLLDDVKGKNAYLFQTFLPNLYDNHLQIWESLEAIDAACLNGAKNITLVASYVPYGRSDKTPGEKKFLPGTNVSLELLIRCWQTAGANRVIIVDPHSKKFAKFFNSVQCCKFLRHATVYEIDPTDLIVSEIKTEIDENPENFVLLTPDEGALERNTRLQKKLGIKMLCADKNRIKDNDVQSIKKDWSTEDTKGKKIIFRDDEVSSGGTVKKTLNGLGASESIVIATHGVFSEGALENLQQIENLEKIIVTDTLPISAEIKDALPVKIISVAGLISQQIIQIEKEIENIK